MSGTMSDDLLLDSLGAALRLDVEPCAADVDALRELVSPKRRRVAPVVLPYRPARQLLRAAALVAAIVIGIGALVAALGADVSPVLRPAARAIGISVDSDQLRDAKTAIASLEAALARDDEAAIQRGARDLVSALQGLDRGDRVQVEDDATRLLQRADAELRRLAADRVAAGASEGETAAAGDAPASATTTGTSEASSAGSGSPAGSLTGPPAATSPTPQPPAVLAPPVSPDDGSEPPESEPEDDDHPETEPGDD
jgi:hypothetical protein